MKQLYKLLMLGLVVAFLATGCAKAPTQEVNDAKAAIEAVTNADTQTYAKDELANVNAAMEAANAEVKLQDDKWFGNFDKAKTMLAAIKTDSENVKTVAATKKEEAKNAAITAQTDAKAAIDAANALVAQAPTGKETKADIEAFKADLTGLTESLAGIQASIDGEKYTEASDSANVIKEKAASISTEVQAALDKVNEKKAAKGKKK
jgi:hypothetical protein